MQHRLRVVPHFSSGIVERAKRERAWKSPHARKADTLSPRRVLPFLAWGDFHARSRFARITIPEKNGGLPVVFMQHNFFNISLPLCDYGGKNARFHALWRRKRAPRRRNFPSFHFLNLVMVLPNSPPIEFAGSYEVTLFNNRDKDRKNANSLWKRRFRLESYGP